MNMSGQVIKALQSGKREGGGEDCTDQVIISQVAQQGWVEQTSWLPGCQVDSDWVIPISSFTSQGLQWTNGKAFQQKGFKAAEWPATPEGPAMQIHRSAALHEPCATSAG
jgi:hypothetical protein